MEVFKKMEYIDFKRIERVIKLDKAVFKEIRDDEKAMGQAIAVLLLAVIIGSIWGIISSMGVFLVFILIVVPIAWVISTGIYHILAKALGGKATFKGYLKVLGYAEAPVALGVIPILGTVVGGLWSFVCAIVATREAHELSTGKAVLVIVIPSIIIMGLILLFFAALVSMMGMSAIYGDAY